jgi:sister chromatid cohesion protein DCC1
MSALEDDHEIKRDVTTQVMTWFGEINLGKWKMNVEDVLKQVGLGILRVYRVSEV